MIAGIDFPSAFAKDTFAERRNHGSVGNPYNPESLITGGEMTDGLAYDTSARNWQDEATYQRAVSGQMTPEEIIHAAPRVGLMPHELATRPDRVPLGPVNPPVERQRVLDYAHFEATGERRFI